MATEDYNSFYINHFGDTNCYPIILAPKMGTNPIAPSGARSDIHAFSMPLLFRKLKDRNIISSVITCSVAVSTVGKTMPYEPEIAIIDADANINIDVEIDSPYHEYYRFPTNYLEKNVLEGGDSMSDSNKNRDDFFRNNGWYVVRFSENQVINNPDGCAALLENLFQELKGENFDEIDFVREPRWEIREAISQEKELYRESCHHIQNFPKPEFVVKTVEGVKSGIGSADADAYWPTVSFDEETHTYSDVRDPSGAANYISVTTLIDRFFPYFDEEAYIEKFMHESGKTREEVVKKMTEPSEMGTFMHEQIEFFLKGEEHREDFKEFELFRHFHEEQILRRGLQFYDAEMQIILPKYNIAGTVDALFRKKNGDFVMVDWKRSKHLIINGFPKKYGFGRGISILNHLDNSSYYHYELQQSMYKYVLEREYGMKISSMILCVLHPEYDRYYTIKLSDYRKKEVEEMIAAHAICNR